MFQSILEDKNFLLDRLAKCRKTNDITGRDRSQSGVVTKLEGTEKKVVYDALFYLHFITDIVSVIAFS